MLNIANVLFYLSAPEGNAGYAQPGTPGNSWGGWLSSTYLSPTPLDDLFLDLTGAENAAGQTDYACVFVVNNDPQYTMLNTFAWLPGASAPGLSTTLQVGADPAGVSPMSSSLPQAATITSSVFAPAGVTFTGVSETAPTGPDYTGGAWIGSIPPYCCTGLWVARTGHNTGPVIGDGCGLQVNFDSRGSN